ncbi:ER membrane protein complex subunit 6-like [Fusarium oxysporum f. sp. vasinfectum]|nr:ER membrane protein complex subunit 6-like [Fusarium oxysporum f. sp. vasinfectum]KAK2938099.1 ER membrane protein complex subunit 6-like [Fusarium oxysporum f. sp. vasinfectum]
MPSERELQINPIVPESVVHNTKVRSLALNIAITSDPLSMLKALSNLHSLTASLFGVSAGVLGLESYYGFLVYIIFSFITALLFYALKVAPESLPKSHAPLDPSRYYRGLFEFWFGGIFNGVSGFVLTWTLFYGLVRA